MSIILPTTIKVNTYKGFTIKIEFIPEENIWYGIAVEKERTQKFAAHGHSKREVGKDLCDYIDIFRRDMGDSKLIIGAK